LTPYPNPLQSIIAVAGLSSAIPPLMYSIIILLLVGPKCALHTYHLRMYELLLDFHSLKKEKLCETAGSSADIIN